MEVLKEGISQSPLNPTFYEKAKGACYHLSHHPEVVKCTAVGLSWLIAPSLARLLPSSEIATPTYSELSIYLMGLATGATGALLIPTLCLARALLSPI